MVVRSQETRVKAKSFQSLVVWQKSHRLVLDIYTTTRNFPVEEKFGLVSQMRRTAVSIPANLAEGFIRRGKRDKVRFYNISQGSLEELKYYLILSEELGYVGSKSELIEKADTIGKMLNRLIESLGNEDV